jgi:diacylglycerol kinase family enzyme
MNRPADTAEATRPVPAVRSAMVVANPTAGSHRRERLDRFAARLRERGVAVDVRFTTHPGHLTAIAASVTPDEADVLVVSGGDGSISEAVSGLIASTGPVPRLAILPAGTANVLAHELRLPRSPVALADAVAAGRTAPLHPGLVGTRPFVLMVSAGFDADVVHAVDPAVKRRWGKLAFAAAALRLAFARGGRDVTVEADGERLVCRLAVVTTARCYGGPMTITHGTDVTRPGLRLVTLAEDAPLDLGRAAIGLARGRLNRVPGVVDRVVEQVRFLGDDIRMQVDGDRLETTDATISAAPAVLRVVVP